MKVFFAFSHTRPIISFQCQFSSTSKVSFEMFEISSNQDHWWSQTDKIVWQWKYDRFFGFCQQLRVYQEKDKGKRCCCYCIPIDSFWSKGSLLFFLVMSDKGSDTIITLIGSVKNVGIIPHKNVDHATPWAAGNRGPYGQPITEYWATEEAKRRWLPRRSAFLKMECTIWIPNNFPTYFRNLMSCSTENLIVWY